MKSLLTIIGIILVVFGIATLAYNGFNYKSEENVAKIGNIEVNAETEKHIYLSPTVSIVSLPAGIILLVMNRRR